MRVKTIKIDPLNPESIRIAAAEVRAYRDWVVRTTNLLVEELLKFGKNEAIFQLDHIDTGETLASIDYDTYFAGRNNKCGVVVAGGHAVWIEFGTGVYNNGGESYPGTRPEGIVGIGQYGKGKGSKPVWLYPTADERWAMRDRDGNPRILEDGMYLARTHGIPANAFMWLTSERIREVLPEYARGLFG